MAYEQKDNSGALFKNTRKRDDNDPVYTGNGMIDGKDYWFSAWMKVAKDGQKFMSLSFKPKEAKPESEAAPPVSDVDEDMPF